MTLTFIDLDVERPKYHFRENEDLAVPARILYDLIGTLRRSPSSDFKLYFTPYRSEGKSYKYDFSIGKDGRIIDPVAAEFFARQFARVCKKLPKSRLAQIKNPYVLFGARPEIWQAFFVNAPPLFIAEAIGGLLKAPIRTVVEDGRTVRRSGVNNMALPYIRSSEERAITEVFARVIVANPMYDPLKVDEKLLVDLLLAFNESQSIPEIILYARLKKTVDIFYGEQENPEEFDLQKYVSGRFSYTALETLDASVKSAIDFKPGNIGLATMLIELEQRLSLIGGWPFVNDLVRKFHCALLFDAVHRLFTQTDQTKFDEHLLEIKRIYDSGFFFIGGSEALGVSEICTQIYSDIHFAILHEEQNGNNSRLTQLTECASILNSEFSPDFKHGLVLIDRVDIDHGLQGPFDPPSGSTSTLPPV